MNHRCSSVSKLLEKYFDQEVTDEEKRLVEGHLPDCPACRETLHSMERVRNLIKSPVEVAIEKESFPWVWQKIEREIRLKERPTVRESLRSWLDRTPLFTRRVLIPAVVALAILIFVAAPLLFKKSTSYPGPSVVEYVESQAYNVMVYELENSKGTVIWLFESPEKEISTS
jgi:predicted anti-sigma-YlaC factor YlaD